MCAAWCQPTTRKRWKKPGIYRSRGDKSHRDAQRTEADKRGWRDAKIQFLGVWDTVGALGIPKLSEAGVFKKLWGWMTEGSKLDHKFHSVHLSPIVKHAAHALALDERRGPFEPSLWRERKAVSGADAGGKEAQDNPGPDEVQQVWFAGVHSNIGGGYVDAGLSDHAFMWMAQRAIKAGLYLNPTYLAHRIDPNAHGELRDTLSGLYEKIPQFVRELDSVDADENPILNEKIHSSVRSRFESQTNIYWLPRVRGKTTRREMLEYFETDADHTNEGRSLITRADSAGSIVKRYKAIHGLTSEAGGTLPPERVIPGTGLGLPEADEAQPIGPRQ
ncbi:MAG: DUF2235 domain-containing protein [Proteobacteria bacterium]|nr:DUF2235 domain-containing protein [Pseudomonadota bacterium]